MFYKNSFVFSLNLSYDLSLSILTDDNKVRDKLHNDIEKFIVNKGNFNKLMGILTFQEENIVTKEWKEKAKNLKDLLLKYSTKSYSF